MARQLAATRDGGRATFLLEVALDRARIKQRLASVLYAERERRGGGDARRFPQPRMAQELGYSLRQYQRLEDPGDPNLPSWNDLERICGVLGIEAADIFGDPEPDATPADVTNLADVRALLELRDELASRHDEVLRRLDSIEALARAGAIAAAAAADRG